MNYAEAKGMADAADAAGVRHMTAFTYRFVPAMRYLGHLIAQGELGEPYHYRSCRLQDWGTRNLGWRQVKALAGTGELGDMLSHRIDFAQHLVGPMKRLVANTKRLVDDREGKPSDLEDWVAIIAEFHERRDRRARKLEARERAQRKLAQPRLRGTQRQRGDVRIHHRQMERAAIRQSSAAPASRRSPVPREFWTWPGSPRDPSVGDPLVTFRYDQAFEFIDAIRNQRPCVPSFHDGVRTQAVHGCRGALRRDAGVGRTAESP